VYGRTTMGHVGVTMDSRKIQRVRRLVASDFYTDPEVLDSILEALVDRHCGQLVRDIERCDKVNQDICEEQAVRVHAQIVDDLKQYPLGDGDRYHEIVADVVAGPQEKTRQFTGNSGS
jgi:hypothetical protein